LFRLSVPSIEKLIMKLTLVMSAMQSCDHLVTQSGEQKSTEFHISDHNRSLFDV
jgi:hypothetical protein